MSAITSLIYLLKSGDHVITIVNKNYFLYYTVISFQIIFFPQKKNDVYSGSSIFFKKYASKMNIEVQFVNMLDLDETEKSFRPNTKVLFFCNLN